MATYFHQNADMQSSADGLQTLLLINPTTYAQYSTNAAAAPQPPPSPPGNNLIFLNSSAPPTANLSHASPTHTHQHQFVGVPLPAAAQDHHANHGFVGRVQHAHLWNPLDPRMAAAAAAAAAAGRETPRSSHQQGLSLSLSSQQPNYNSGASLSRNTSHAMSGDDVRMTSAGGSSSMSVSGSVVTNGISETHGVILSSKYLKAAQELLDEVVNAGNEIEGLPLKKGERKSGHGKAASGEPSEATNGDGGSGGGETNKGKGEAEFSASERQEVQIKKAKLVGMLEEVEQRYRQYHHQMQMVISSFEQVAGIGSSKFYTSLALRTISKQFRCLKDAITGQIRAVNKSLGEEDSLGGKLEGSRFKFVDQHIRQQRALQQLGMIQHNAWRPQRGLPERAVSVLRAWLFEHFLHPYPKDSDKQMLAKQTGLTRGQVSNWFINARVRLWKPMVEEMYLEETKEQGKNGSVDKASKSEHDEGPVVPQDKNPASENCPKNFISKQESSMNQSAPSIRNSTGSSSSPAGGNIGAGQPGFSHIAPSLFGGITSSSPKKPRTTEMLQSSDGMQPIDMDIKAGEASNEQVSMKFGNQRHSQDGYALMGSPANFIGGFGQYPIGEIGRFDAEQFAPRLSANGVSLTLGLPHCDNLSLSGSHQNFYHGQNILLGRRPDITEQNEFGAMDNSAPHSSAAYDSVDIQTRKRFAAQLLPDFVT